MLLLERADFDGVGVRQSARPVDVVVDGVGGPAVGKEPEGSLVPAGTEGEVGEELFGGDGEGEKAEVDGGGGAVAGEGVQGERGRDVVGGEGGRGVSG